MTHYIDRLVIVILTRNKKKKDLSVRSQPVTMSSIADQGVINPMEEFDVDSKEKTTAETQSIDDKLIPF